jgi:hypothetical protein
MRILVATSWGGACGIANYADLAIAAIRQADPSLEFEPSAEALDPDWVERTRTSHPGGIGWSYDGTYGRPPTVWLNYHRGLHSRWTPEKVEALKHYARVVITFHDTYGERPPDDLQQQLHDLADVFVVHEPCEGLPKQILIRQGVPAATHPTRYNVWDISPEGRDFWGNYAFKQYAMQPVLGTCGFNFGWKSFDRLAEVTAVCGWAYLVQSNNATDADEARWKAANPWTCVVRGFQPTATIVSLLAGCDATCWAYECANSGTSGAIRLGLAARKPVIAWQSCRQFRDLSCFDWYDPPPLPPDDRVQWCGGFAELPSILERVPIQRVDPGIVALAERDSWVNQGKKYAAIFAGLA